MTTSAKNIVAHVQNIGKSLINPNNYDDNNYDEVSDAAQYASISHGNDFYKYQMSLKNKANYITEGFNGHLSQATESVLLNTTISSAQQLELTRLKQQYTINQASYNILITSILPTNGDNSEKLQQLSQLETTLDLLAQQINTLNDILQNDVTNVNSQISTNSITREE